MLKKNCESESKFSKTAESVESAESTNSGLIVGTRFENHSGDLNKPDALTSRRFSHRVDLNELDILNFDRFSQPHTWKKLGEGGFATVSETYDKLLNRLVVMKRMDSKHLDVALNEWGHGLTMFGHALLPKTHQLLRDGNQLYLIEDKVAGESLETCLSDYSEGLDPHIAGYIFSKIALFVKALNEKGIEHRDLSLKNIMLEREPKNGGGVYVIDLGSASFIQFPSRYAMGNKRFMPPDSDRKNEPVDVWSLGVLLHIMLTGQDPFSSSPFLSAACCASAQSRSDDSPFRDIALAFERKMDNESAKSLAIEVVDLLSKMLVVDPAQRISIEEVMNHQWTQNSKHRIWNQGEIYALSKEVVENSKRKVSILEGEIVPFLSY